jgi:hypothetical protein
VARLVAVDDANEEPDTANGHCLHVVPRAIKQRADEPPPLEAVGPGEGVPPV